MKINLKHSLTKALGVASLFISGNLLFTACSKNSSSTNTPKVTATVIGSNTTLTGGAWKGVMLAGQTYTINGDITVLPTDSLIVQAGATINLPGNHAFYVQGVFQSLGTPTQPITFTAPTAQPGQWGGFQADSCKGFTAYWTKFLWAGGPDSTGSTRQTISISTPIPVDIEDCWFVGGQDNGIGVYSTANVKILRNSVYGEGTTDGEAIDFHSGVTGVVAYNVIWGGAGSAVKVYTSATIQNPQTNVEVYNNTCVDNGFRRGAAEPGRGVLVDAFSQARVYNNLLVNNYWSLDVTQTADTIHTLYNNNYFYVTVDSLLQFMYPAGEAGFAQNADIINFTTLGANNPMFVGYSAPPNPSLRIIPSSFDFHLQSGSPALGKGYTGTVAGLPNGVPALSSDIGAYVTDTSGGKGNRHAPGF
jgi:Right handed beta helix region